MRTEDLDKRDYKFIVEKGEPGFSPERNKMVVEHSIKKMDAWLAKRKKEYKENLAERVDALAQYFQHMQYSNNPPDKYFGKRWMAYLRGELLMDRIRGQRIEMDTSKLAGNILKSN